MIKAHPLTWYSALTSVSYCQRNWLQDRGSLTRRIQDRCDQFCVKRVFQSLSRVYGDELDVMGLRANELAMVREVYLYCGDTPVVFAHSVVAHKSWAINRWARFCLPIQESSARHSSLRKSVAAIFFMIVLVLVCQRNRRICGRGAHCLHCTDNRF